MTTALLSSAYCAPVQWFQKLNRYDMVLVEQYDHFLKQTYRNRCVIATANGTQSLTIPVERPEEEKCLMRDVRISDHGNWRRQHWTALATAYGDSPFFDYYADDLRPLFEKKRDFLFDFNMELTQLLCELLDVRPQIGVTSGYAEAAANDFRDAIRPKHPMPDADFNPQPYYQVYDHRHGFIPNLSVLDLLFNMGNEAIFYL
ncbi:MAG: WbqC family protein [Prevotella sp.]|uniref:WbqC family protein n=1 Tax=Prevotella sp. TaxID=59823 RepID=UPI002A31216B|nr:WbqC family protein [Prevotella sp.]MDD7318427.1 WbqC family protein [Prevotellaceae bacterium]MDY4020222.1 WbqC family protein [Prevotella sp.]